MLLKGLWTRPRTLIWSEEALAFLGPHEHSPMAAGVEMSTPLGQEASEKETQLKSHLHSLAVYLASLSLSFLICGNEMDPSQPPEDAGSIMGLFAWTSLVTWKMPHQPLALSRWS